MEIGVITNPNSRKNLRKPDRAQVLQSIVGDLGEVHQTPDPDAIKPVLREFLRRRARFWVSDGGDGALHWMLRKGLEVLQEEEFRGFSLPLAMPTNGGSIDFVAHNVGLRGNAESLLSGLRSALESGQEVEEVEVDSMTIDGIEVTDEGEVPLRTLGFAVAAGGVGQRFFSKMFEAGQHTSSTIVSIVAKTVSSYPVAMSPLRHIPGMPQVLRQFALDMFKPTVARITVDGQVLRRTDCTGIHVASMSINLGGVFRFFTKADVDGQLHAIAGSPTPYQIIRNIPRMYMGLEMVGDDLFDGPCREMTMEAASDELLGPIIDGEYYPNIRKMTFKLGPRVRIPKVVGRHVRTIN
jgi:hypothetical protein